MPRTPRLRALCPRPFWRLLWVASCLYALPAGAQSVPVRADLLVEASSLQAGQDVRVGLQFVIAPGWHIYAREPGDAGFATEVEFGSGDMSFGPLLWPPAHTFRENDKVVTYGYAEQVLLVSQAQVQESAGGAVSVTAQARFLACNVTCSPGQLTVTRTLPVGPTRQGPEQRTAAAFAQFDAALAAPASALPTGPTWAYVLRMLLAAFVGGVLLNAMPCVLPVLFMKAASLAQLGPNSGHARRHGLAYTLGVVASMEGLAACVLLARALGQQVGWGFQFQQPLFVAAVAVALVVFAANCLGAFELSPAVDRLAAAHDRAQGLRRSVLEGVLAVLVATPCSTPFLGTAVAFALGEGPGVVVATFAAVGLGLAAPYLALATVPATRRLLPRPGPWMLAVKTLLGYALLATAIWLAWVLGRAQGPDALVALLLWAWVAAAGAQLLGAVLRRLPHHTGAGFACLLALLLACGGQLLPWLNGDANAALAAQAAVETPYSEAALLAAKASHRPVFVDFTADWCVTCKYNERHVLADAKLQAAFARHKVVTLRADWTRRDDAVLRILQAHGRAGVPMYLLYLPNNPTPTLLPEVLTVATVLQALGEP